MANATPSDLAQVIDHVFLPSKLPRNPSDISWEGTLLRLLLESLNNFQIFVAESDRSCLKLASTSIANFRALRSPAGYISEGTLAEALRGRDETVLPLNVQAQNAAILIRKTAQVVHFECFELSPADQSVITTKGRLRRCFPEASVTIPLEALSQDGFATAIASMIAKMSHQAVSEMQPRVMKAGYAHVEIRDTTLPHMVTELFASMLLPYRDSSAAQAPSIWKNTRDEVNYGYGSYLPWRRSPTWLLLRVSLQRILASASSSLGRDGLYKRFMVYFMSHIMKSAFSESFDMEIIHVMNAKLAQRIRKLNIGISESWMPSVQTTIQQATAQLESRWKIVMDADRKELNWPASLLKNMDQDLLFTLPEIDSFIKEISNCKHVPTLTAEVPASQMMHFPSHSLPNLRGINNTSPYRMFNFTAFENWVSAHLDSWLNTHMDDPQSCSHLRGLIVDYHTTATMIYKDFPEGNSLMLITILDLWIACDKSAIQIHPLLVEYDPGISPEICQALLLRFRSGMERLSKIEQYLLKRKEQAKYKSILTSFGDKCSFSVRYFDTSEKHQRLLHRIEEEASNERQKKVEELKKLQAKHAAINAASAAEEHGYRKYKDLYGDIQSEHSKDCKKCDLQKQAEKMEITLHEWPLPTSELKAKSTVFELDVPVAYGCWRDLILFMRRNILKPGGKPRGIDYYCRLISYDALPTSSIGTYQQRIVLASSTKPHASTHRESKFIASIVDEKDVCLENGMRWAYYDGNEQQSLAGDNELSLELCKMCTFGVGKAFDEFLRRSWEEPDGKTPNRVIASQSSCPDHLSVDEYKALCGLPLGHKILWENILAQLAMPSVDWRKLETVLFVWQTTHQAGPPSASVLRASHEALDDRLVRQLLIHLNKNLTRFRGSWESAGAVGAFVIIATRLLSLGSMAKSQLCLEFLEECRKTCYDWLTVLRRGILSAVGEKSRSEFCQRALQAALIGVKTFDVEDTHLKQLLRSPEMAAMYLELSIAVKDTQHCLKLTMTSLERTVLYAFLLCQRRLTFRTYKTLSSEIIDQAGTCLDSAIRKIWPAYHPKGQWTANSNSWLTIKSYSQDRQTSLAVHFNLVTAELLVNGLPLARMPADYEAHSTYKMLIGQNPVEAMPSAEPGMTFSANKALHGYQLHFAKSGEDLLVRAWNGENPWDHVPSRLLHKKVPRRFEQNYSHWYDVRNEIIQFRPRADPWKSSGSLWTLSRVGPTWRLQRGQVSLLNPLGSISRCLAMILSPLEKPSGIHMSYDGEAQCLEIAIPRLQIEFEMAPGSDMIKSRQYRDMCIDRRQESGSLFGLRNKLLLRRFDDCDTRMVLIPESTPTWNRAGLTSTVQYTTVEIAYDAQRVQVYRMDKYLGRFVGNGSLQSKLFLAQLHALTSGCLPDPFTHYTGTEEALNILRSAGVRSFDRLTKENLDILLRIAAISPIREHYPATLQVMQVVEWDPKLGFLAQTSLLRREVEQLLVQAKQTSFLHPGADGAKFPSLATSDTHLTERDDIRSSTFRLEGFGAELKTESHDKEYKRPGKDENAMLGRTELVARTANCFKTTESRLMAAVADKPDYIYHALSSIESSFKYLKASDANLPRLQYDSYWLDDSKGLLRELWLYIHLTLKQGPESRPHRFQVMTWLATMAFSISCDQFLLDALVGMVQVEPTDWTVVPQDTYLLLKEGTLVQEEELRRLALSGKKMFVSTNLLKENRRPRETGKQTHQRLERAFLSKQDELLSDFVSALQAQWPERPRRSEKFISFDPYFDTSKILGLVTRQFNSWKRNAVFQCYLDQITGALSGLGVADTSSLSPNHYHIKAPYSAREAPGSVRFIDLLDLITPPSTEDISNSIPAPELFKTTSAPTGSRITELLKLLEEVTKSTQEKEYVEHLTQSTACLSGHNFASELNTTSGEVKRILESYYLSSKAHYDSLLLSFQRALGGREGGSSAIPPALRMVSGTYQWPRICPRVLLSQLNRTHREGLTDQWKEALVGFGVSLSQLQAAQRLLQLEDQEVDLRKELGSLEPRGWNPIEYPDSLLLEIEGNLRIRKIQSEIAKTMESPPNGENAVMQLNMGEGKSSVIVPIVAASLADTSRLVRVIVARPQSRQMFEMLVSKLGGLIGRRVFHMPFSRSLKLTQSEASFLRPYYDSCRREGGILLIQPENILSFQLMVIEKFIKGETQVARKLLDTQRDFEQHSRDIVDESDENFSTKFELVYTMGQQRTIDFAPDRWTIIQQVLQLVARYSRRVKDEMPQSLEMEDVGDGRYPRIRFLDDEVSAAVLSMVVDHLCENGLVPGFPIAQQTIESRKALRTYVSDPSPPQELIDSIEKGGFWTTAKDSLLLIRGLFSSGLLGFVFGKKRWRVNYGLVRTRQPPTSLAVPYQAKDKPSARSEFSHPDVVICLTSLSYYYGGLNDDELFLALAKVSRSDQADTEYQAWVASAPGLPSSFRHVQGVNIRDREQCRTEVFPHLKFSKGAVDYFLSHIVFTREMKEFPERLSASGWDIGRKKAYPTTGFSGTNDSRDVLPLNVEQLDLESQKHTNALVLEYLLRQENSVALLREAGYGGACKATELLKLIIKMTPEVRVILDVGAQIIELTNKEVARTWLRLLKNRSDVHAAIFCDDADHICVLDRKGRVERLQTSPFADQLDVCLVYLDQAHTRGIDLRLPQHYRAAVTLGADVVKDRLVQACMRMRKLGFGQSVVFLVSNEIETKIRKMKADKDAPIGIADVLAWSIHETWADTRHSIPIWATQGNTFVKHQALWTEAWNEPSRLEASEGSEGSLVPQFLEDEAQSLDRRYRPQNQASFMDKFDASENSMVARIIQRCSEFDGLNHNTSSLLEEQERELSPEIEQERQRELAAPAEPCKHRIHSEVRHFARTGEMAAVGQGFLCAFSVFHNTTAAAHFDLDQWPKGLLVTRDFADTVMNVQTGSKKGDAMDDYQRNIQWLLSNRSADGRVTHLAVLSPFEANGLRSEVASSKKAVLHIYAPRQNVGCTPVDDLKLYCVPSSAQQVIPRRLVIELNLFAGQLYFSSYKEYTEVCDYLCLAWKPATDGMVVRSDGFIVKDDKEEDSSGDGKGTRFHQSPVQFLKVLFTKIRRNTEGVEKTDLGKVLNGAYLTEEDFEERDSSIYIADE